MADKSVGELIAAQSVTPTDLFVLEQNGTAKKLTGQILENWLVSFADGHGGIQSIKKLSTSGLVDTYRITLADTTTFDFAVTNGRSITGISKTSTSGLVDTYTISYNDGTTSKFTVTNGAKGDKGDNAYIWIKYSSQKPTESSHSMGDLPDDWIGIYSGNAATAPTDWQQYTWYQIKGEKGDTGAAATVTGTTVEYMISDSGTIVPSGSWSTTIPTVPQGKYLWTRVTTTFNTGSPVVSYSVTRMGIDGTGSVSTVNSVSPDSNGNVTLTASDVPTSDSTSVQSRIAGIESNVSGLQTRADEIVSNFAGCISGKKVSIIGDSISTFNADGYKTEGYAQYYPNANIPDVVSVEDTWWKKVLDACGCVLEKNAAYSGSRATNTDSSKPSFYARCTTALLGNPDTILVELGTNDSNGAVAIGVFDYTTDYTSLSEATFATAYIKGIKALKALYPNAQIICVALNMDVAYRNAICKIAQFLGCNHVTSKAYEKGSGSHPNANGMRQIASAVLSLQNSDSAFRTAVVSTRYIEDGSVYLNNNDYAFGIAPSSNLTGNGITWAGLQNTSDAFIRHYIRADGEYRLRAQVNGKDGNNNVIQHYVYLAVDGSGTPVVVCSNPEAWRKALGLSYAPGDTFVTEIFLSESGYVTSSAQAIHLNVVVPKSLENISTITVQSLAGQIRGISGYVDNSSSTSFDWLSGYTVLADKVSDNVVHIQIRKSTALENVTNNTVVVGNLAMSLAFA